VDRIWQAHWPPGVDEARIRLPDDSLPARLKATAARLPRKTALVFYGREISFAELDEASDRFAAWLRGRGVGPGDRVALYLENCPQFAVAHFGALKVGAITVALNPMHKAHELGHELEDSGARVVVAADAGREVVEGVRDRTALDTAVLVSYRDYLPEEPTLPLPPSLLEDAPRRPRGWEDFRATVGSAATLRALEPRARHDTALIQYTSGTTGAPKGAELTHGNVTANCELIRAFFGIGAADVLLGVVPWFHITGMEVQLNLMAYTGRRWWRSIAST
jgi:long-chain acyl-CoA synthetase